MTKSGGDFVFGNKPVNTAGAPLAAEISDTDAVGHIRNYSNYLIPRGFRDVITRGGDRRPRPRRQSRFGPPACASAPALTVWSNPDRSALLRPDLFGFSLAKYLPVENFGITLALSLFGLLLYFAWALRRSFLQPDRLSEFRTRLPKWAGLYLVLLVASFFCELQPFVIAGMFDIADARAGFSSELVLGLVTSGSETGGGCRADRRGRHVFSATAGRRSQVRNRELWGRHASACGWRQGFGLGCGCGAATADLGRVSLHVLLGRSSTTPSRPTPDRARAASSRRRSRSIIPATPVNFRASFHPPIRHPARRGRMAEKFRRSERVLVRPNGCSHRQIGSASGLRVTSSTGRWRSFTSVSDSCSSSFLGC